MLHFYMKDLSIFMPIALLLTFCCIVIVQVEHFAFIAIFAHFFASSFHPAVADRYF